MSDRLEHFRKFLKEKYDKEPKAEETKDAMKAWLYEGADFDISEKPAAPVFEEKDFIQKMLKRGFRS